MYQLNTFNITKMRVSINGQMGGGGRGGTQPKKHQKMPAMKLIGT